MVLFRLVAFFMCIHMYIEVATAMIVSISVVVVAIQIFVSSSRKSIANCAMLDMVLLTVVSISSGFSSGSACVAFWLIHVVSRLLTSTIFLFAEAMYALFFVKV